MTESADVLPEEERITLSYRDAISELDELLDELEGADVDIDQLAEQVARGVVLVRFCRDRLEVVSGEVDGVVTDLLASTSPDPDPRPDDTAA